MCKLCRNPKSNHANSDQLLEKNYQHLIYKWWGFCSTERANKDCSLHPGKKRSEDQTLAAFRSGHWWYGAALSRREVKGPRGRRSPAGGGISRRRLPLPSGSPVRPTHAVVPRTRRRTIIKPTHLNFRNAMWPSTNLLVESPPI